jgi:hypothetical protein
MRRVPRLAALFPVILAGCQALPHAPAAPDPLAVTDPMVERALYQVTDSATFQVNPGAAGVMGVSTGIAATVQVDAWRSGDVVEARIRYLRLRGTLRAAGMDPSAVDETAIGGVFQVRVDPRGRIEVFDRPTLAPALLDVVGAESLIRPLFVQLPGRVADPGDVWVDTLMTVEETDGVRTVARTILTTTLVGDTVVEGRALVLLRTRAENRIEADGLSGGVAVRQRLEGETLGTVVWDPRLQLLVGRREAGELAGTLRLGELERELPVSAGVRRSVELER